jgi:hypothetical protein
MSYSRYYWYFRIKGHLATEDGEFKDAYEGFVSKYDENYSFFVDIMDGKYVGKEFPIK